MRFDGTTYRFTDPGSFGKFALIAGIAGLALSAIGIFVNLDQFLFSWLVAFTFWVSIALGGLFMVMLHHLTGAIWSVATRRISEAVASVGPFMILFALPVLLGIERLYLWSDADLVAHDEVLIKKTGYLNEWFFVIRTLTYFFIWTFLIRSLNLLSLRQDQGWQSNAEVKFNRVSGPGMVAFALTVTFAGFDWIMSLEPHWYSTIYGVWFFAGGITAIMAMMGLVVNGLQAKGILRDELTEEHRHDIGKLLFAFMVFWGYMHLSQYLLIWYANLPEETLFYKMRWGAGWTTFSIILVVGGFVIPFVMLMGRTLKRNPRTLTFFASWLLLMHWVDLYWNIMPNFHRETVVLSWLDLTTMVGVGGMFLWLFWRRFTKYPILPVTDPKLESSFRLVSG